LVGLDELNIPPAPRLDLGDTMPLAALFAIDLVAISLLTFALYFPRHRRRDLVVALIGLNVGVLGVTQALSSAEVSAGLGLGLFGVLSIIRLRSAEMDQSEIAYYFAALTLGLLGGFPVDPSWVSPALMVAVIAAVLVADHPALFRRYRHTTITLDRAYPDEQQLRANLGELLGAEVLRVNVLKVDLVNDTTLADVRYRLRRDGEAPTQSYVAAEFEVGR
jgi:hypothetical protein